MTPKEFGDHIQRVETICPRVWKTEPELVAKWVEEIRRRFEAIDAAEFARVIDGVIDRHDDPRVLPPPARFLAVRESVRLGVARKGCAHGRYKRERAINGEMFVECLSCGWREWASVVGTLNASRQ